MTDTPTPTPSTALAPRQRDPAIERYRELGYWLSLAEADDKTEKGRGAAAALRLYYADQLELPPVAANDLVMIKGRLFIQANVLRALAARRGYRVQKVDSSHESCTAVLYQQGEEIGRETYTLDQARRAKIVKERSAWETHPDRMLWARASSFVIRDYAPEVALGLHTIEELDFIEGEAVEVPDEGELTPATPAEPAASAAS